jgi:hypothetical protein
MADTADRILADLRRRRDELKPLVGELERIEAAIDALERVESDYAGGTGNGARARATGGSSPRSSGPAPAAPSPGRRRRGRPPKGDGPNRADQFLELIRHGAVSIPAAAREMGIGPNYLYRIAAMLESEGTIRKEGRDYVMNVESAPSENADVLPTPEDEPDTAGRDNGDDDDLVTDEGVNEGTREIVEE